jgi:hypothetical protein
MKARVAAQQEGWEHVLRDLVAVTPNRDMRATGMDTSRNPAS